MTSSCRSRCEYDGHKLAGLRWTEPTIDLTLNAAGLRLLLDAVTHELDRWSGGEPSEQDNLQEMKTLLTAALLECTFQDN